MKQENRLICSPRIKIGRLNPELNEMEEARKSTSPLLSTPDTYERLGVDRDNPVIHIKCDSNRRFDPTTSLSESKLEGSELQVLTPLHSIPHLMLTSEAPASYQPPATLCICGRWQTRHSTQLGGFIKFSPFFLSLRGRHPTSLVHFCKRFV